LITETHESVEIQAAALANLGKCGGLQMAPGMQMNVAVATDARGIEDAEVARLFRALWVALTPSSALPVALMPGASAGPLAMAALAEGMGARAEVLNTTCMDPDFLLSCLQACMPPCVQEVVLCWDHFLHPHFHVPGHAVLYSFMQHCGEVQRPMQLRLAQWPSDCWSAVKDNFADLLRQYACLQLVK
jgi:hypothetical protein